MIIIKDEYSDNTLDIQMEGRSSVSPCVILISDFEKPN